MPIKKPVAVFRSITLAVLLGCMATESRPTLAKAESKFHLARDPQGLVQPFRAVSLPLPEFVREYARLTGTVITVDGPWDQELKGGVTLFVHHALKAEVLTEVFHRVLNENGFAVVDAPASNGWIIERIRDARDAALPVYEMSQVPDSSRMVTAYRDFKYADAENVSRTLRSYMPAHSRIIPTTSAQVFITDTASNIRKLNWMIARLDTEDAAKIQKSSTAWYSGSSTAHPRTCGEVRIEKLTVEKLEVQENGNGSGTGSGSATKPVAKDGVKK